MKQWGVSETVFYYFTLQSFPKFNFWTNTVQETVRVAKQVTWCTATLKEYGQLPPKPSTNSFIGRPLPQTQPLTGKALCEYLSKTWVDQGGTQNRSISVQRIYDIAQKQPHQ